MISILTGNDEARVLKRLDPKVIAEKWRNSLGVDVGDNFRNLPFIEYLQCDATGFCWYAPPEAAGGRELYEQLEKFDWYYMKNKWEFSIAIKLLKGVKNVLEIGAGEGNFLQLAKNADLDIQGIELNPKAAERARNLGFKVHEKMIHELSQEISDRFDAICSFQVLEHVPDPMSFLRGMLNMLRPGGKLILSVPNAAVMRNIDPNNLELLNQPPHHMGHWDEKVFRALERLLPLMVKSVHHEPLAPYHIAWMVTGYLRSRFSKLGSSISRLLFNRYTTMPLQLILHAGLRNYFPGHTLLVELEYQPR